MREHKNKNRKWVYFAMAVGPRGVYDAAESNEPLKLTGFFESGPQREPIAPFNDKRNQAILERFLSKLSQDGWEYVRSGGWGEGFRAILRRQVKN